VQIKWIALAGSITGTLVFLGIMAGLLLLPESMSPEGIEGAPPLWLQLLMYALTLSFAGVPVAIGFAVLKYRLYDIDVLINRALVYASLTVMLALVYVGTVASLQGVFRASPVRSPPSRSWPPPWRLPPCSHRCVGGCRRWWIDAFTAVSTTRQRPWPPSTLGCATETELRTLSGDAWVGVFGHGKNRCTRRTLVVVCVRYRFEGTADRVAVLIHPRSA
jgi:hypothetical protein